MTARPSPSVLVAAIAAVAVALRLPWVVSRAPIGYDDGAYLTSVLAMRHGQLPFRDVFSSQGPAFLPVLWLADLAGLRAPWAARLAPLTAGVVLVVVTHRLGLLVADRSRALAAAALVATSGCLLLTTFRIESDAIAAAFASAAFLVAASGRTSLRDATATSALAGLALAVKSLLVGPVLLATGWVLFRRLGWQRAAAMLAGAAIVAVALAVPWGLGAVWDQSIALHLDADGHRTPGANASFVWRELLGRDRLLLAGGALAAVAAASAARRPARSPLGEALWLWLASSVAVLVLHAPLNIQHLTALVVPAALLVARYRPPVPALAVLALVLLPTHAGGAGWRLSSPEPTPAERAIVEQLRSIEPVGSLVVTDEPALGWLAGAESPGALVDPSFVRIAAGGLTTKEAVDAATAPGVCAVLFWSGRLDQLAGLRDGLVEYRRVISHGGHRELWLREGCRLREPD